MISKEQIRMEMEIYDTLSTAKLFFTNVVYYHLMFCKENDV